jgi:hypothetical protein
VVLSQLGFDKMQNFVPLVAWLVNLLILTPFLHAHLKTSGVQPSSCLSDKEEDEIYGFGYGVYGRQMYQRQQQVAQQPSAPIYQR